MRAGAQYHAEHADPAEFINERCQSRQEGRGQEQHGQPRGTGQAALKERCFLFAPGQAVYDKRQQDIDYCGREYGARQAGQFDQHEPADQYTDSRADTVTEIQHRYRPAGVLTVTPQQAVTHQRKGGAEQERLRQDQQRTRQPFEGMHPAGFQARQDMGIGNMQDEFKRRVKDQPEQADDAFRDCIQ